MLHTAAVPDLKAVHNHIFDSVLLHFTSAAQAHNHVLLSKLIRQHIVAQLSACSLTRRSRSMPSPDTEGSVLMELLHHCFDNAMRATKHVMHAS
jgi:hypothetical protein